MADDVDAGHRYNAACVAALAGCGRGEDGAKLSAEEQARWRKQARAWLRADLTAWSAKLESDRPRFRDLIRQKLAHWRTDPDLEGLRQPGALEKLSADERADSLALWEEIGGLLKRTTGP